MKTKIYALLLFCIMGIYLPQRLQAQDYQLFNVNSRKVYQTNSDSAQTYSVIFDSVVVNNNSTILYPNRDINFYPLDPGNCSMWGPCFERNAPTWIGISVEKVANGVYNFVNSDMEILDFNFNIDPYGLHVFYEDDVQRFTYQYDPTIETYTIDGIVDSVKVYYIIHTTLSGSVIMSELQGREIIVGKDLGLIKFFVVNGFPDVLIPLTLLGTNSPDANSPDVGLTKITYADIYDYYPGDEIQYIEYSFDYNGPPFLNYHRYLKETYLERNETDEFLNYTVATELFYSDSLDVTKDTIVLSYVKNTVIAEIPFEFENSENKINTSLRMVNHFGVNHWLYSEDNFYLNLLFCGDRNLWCTTEDTYEYTYRGYELGLGLCIQGWRLFNDRGNGKDVVYYKKDGVKYGDEVVVNVNNLYVDKGRLKIVPNPAKDNVRIEGDFVNGAVFCIKDLNGRYVVQSEKLNKEQVIDVSHLTPGVYLLLVISSEKVYSGKLVIR